MSWLARPTLFRRAMNCWPPFLGAGIAVTRISDDWRTVVVRMKMRFYNRNYFGTHFGGSLFAMTDPFYALMLAHNLGRDYWVWDKSGDIEFVKPGKGTVTATFELDTETVSTVARVTADGEKHFQDFVVEILDEHDDVVARLNKTVYVRKKSRERNETSPDA
ncbi:MAG: DUF4442 domain-containing protein [Gammaproteobacteria bacterium]